MQLAFPRGAPLLVALAALRISGGCTSTAPADPCPADNSSVGAACSIEERVCQTSVSASCSQELRCVSGKWILDGPSCGASTGSSGCVTDCTDVVTNGATPCPGSEAETLAQAFSDCICLPANCGASDCSGPCAGSGQMVSSACDACATNTAGAACKMPFDACTNAP